MRFSNDIVWPEGEYQYTVVTAKETQSKKGNDMIEMQLCVFNDGEGQINLKTYLLEAMPKLLKHFCASHGLTAEYEKGELAAETCVGKSGWLLLGVQPAEGNFPEKNFVDDFLMAEAETTGNDTPPEAPPMQHSSGTPF